MEEDEIIGVHEHHHEEDDLDQARKAFLFPPDAIPENKSKDRIEIKFAGAITRSDLPAHFRYRSINQTKIEKGKPDPENDVEIWRSSLGDFIASCSCPARLICKHIIESAKIHKGAIDAGFLKEQ